MTATASPTTVACIGCGALRVRVLGFLPVFTPDVLGQPRTGPGPRDSLYACRNCELLFRWPPPGPDDLDRYYRSQTSDERWQYEPERPVWRAIRQSLAPVPVRSILDVGCFRGDLLQYLGPGWTRHGVEPSVDAAQEASRRGVEILGPTVEALDAGDRRFGAITLVDVIEHLQRPMDCLHRLADLLVPGGRLVVFTGSTDAWSWRLAGLDYWYSALPEHVAFFCPAWFRWAAPRLGCEIRSVRRMPHRPAPWRTRLDEAGKNVLYAAYHRLSRMATLAPLLGRVPGLRRVGRWDGCWWTTARDHVLVTLERT